jgi:peroxiredoxin
MSHDTGQNILPLVLSMSRFPGNPTLKSNSDYPRAVVLQILPEPVPGPSFSAVSFHVLSEQPCRGFHTGLRKFRHKNFSDRSIRDEIGEPGNSRSACSERSLSPSVLPILSGAPQIAKIPRTGLFHRTALDDHGFAAQDLWYCLFRGMNAVKLQNTACLLLLISACVVAMLSPAAADSGAAESTKTQPAANSASAASETPLRPGDKAPSWQQVPGADDESHSLADLDAHDVIVVCFTSNTCLYSIDYEDRLKLLHQKYQENGSKVAIVAINSNDGEGDSLQAMKDRVIAKEFVFDYLKDESQQVARSYGAIFTPEFFVLNRERVIIYRGAMDDHTDAARATKSYVELAVEAGLNNNLPEVSEVPAPGCKVRYRNERRNSRKKK